jgi:hypothetical protein
MSLATFLARIIKKATLGSSDDSTPDVTPEKPHPNVARRQAVADRQSHIEKLRPVMDWRKLHESDDPKVMKPSITWLHKYLTDNDLAHDQTTLDEIDKRMYHGGDTSPFTVTVHPKSGKIVTLPGAIKAFDNPKRYDDYLENNLGDSPRKLAFTFHGPQGSSGVESREYSFNVYSHHDPELGHHPFRQVASNLQAYPMEQFDQGNVDNEWHPYEFDEDAPDHPNPEHRKARVSRESALAAAKEHAYRLAFGDETPTEQKSLHHFLTKATLGSNDDSTDVTPETQSLQKQAKQGYAPGFVDAVKLAQSAQKRGNKQDALAHMGIARKLAIEHGHKSGLFAARDPKHIADYLERHKIAYPGTLEALRRYGTDTEPDAGFDLMTHPTEHTVAAVPVKRDKAEEYDKRKNINYHIPSNLVDDVKLIHGPNGVSSVFHNDDLANKAGLAGASIVRSWGNKANNPSYLVSHMDGKILNGGDNDVMSSGTSSERFFFGNGLPQPSGAGMLFTHPDRIKITKEKRLMDYDIISANNPYLSDSDHRNHRNFLDKHPIHNTPYHYTDESSQEQAKKDAHAHAVRLAWPESVSHLWENLPMYSHSEIVKRQEQENKSFRRGYQPLRDFFVKSTLGANDNPDDFHDLGEHGKWRKGVEPMLADYLEENDLHHDDDTLKALRMGDGLTFHAFPKSPAGKIGVVFSGKKNAYDDGFEVTRFKGPHGLFVHAKEPGEEVYTVESSSPDRVKRDSVFREFSPINYENPQKSSLDFVINHAGKFPNEHETEQKSLSAFIIKARAKWNAELHPRDDGGRFVSKEAITAASKSPKKAEQLRAKVTDPDQRAKLDAAIEAHGKGDTSVGTKKHIDAAHRLAEKIHGKGTSATREELEAFQESLQHKDFTKDDLHELADRLGVRASGNKDTVRSKVAERGVARDRSDLRKFAGKKTSVADAKAKLQAAVESGELDTPQGRQKLQDMLTGMSRADVRALAKDMGVKVSGSKDMMAAQVAKRTGRKVDEQSDLLPENPETKHVYSVPVESLQTDPKRFQYKVSGIGKDGVTDVLKGTDKWNPELGGVLLVWRDPSDGQDYVVNGHHRHELASRAGADSVNVRYIDAANAKEARAKGALANIAEGSGTAIDAAKYLRDSGQDVEHLRKAGVSLSGKIAADAAVLKKLSDEAFQQLATGYISEAQGVAVAKHLSDPAQQQWLIKRLKDREENGKDWSPRMLERAAKKLANAGKVTVSEDTLFGTFDNEESTFDQETELEDHIASRLGQKANDYSAVANQKRADRVSDAGNVLAVEENAKRRDAATKQVNDFERMAASVSPVSERIQELAAKLRLATKKSDREKIKAEAFAAVQKVLESDTANRPVFAKQSEEGNAQDSAAPELTMPSALTDEQADAMEKDRAMSDLHSTGKQRRLHEQDLSESQYERVAGHEAHLANMGQWVEDKPWSQPARDAVDRAGNRLSNAQARLDAFLPSRARMLPLDKESPAAADADTPEVAMPSATALQDLTTEQQESIKWHEQQLAKAEKWLAEKPSSPMAKEAVKMAQRKLEAAKSAAPATTADKPQDTQPTGNPRFARNMFESGPDGDAAFEAANRPGASDSIPEVAMPQSSTITANAVDNNRERGNNPGVGTQSESPKPEGGKMDEILVSHILRGSGRGDRNRDSIKAIGGVIPSFSGRVGFIGKYNADAIAAFKRIPGAKYSSSTKVWHVPADKADEAQAIADEYSWSRDNAITEADAIRIAAMQKIHDIANQSGPEEDWGPWQENAKRAAEIILSAPESAFDRKTTKMDSGTNTDYGNTIASHLIGHARYPSNFVPSWFDEHKGNNPLDRGEA